MSREEMIGLLIGIGICVLTLPICMFVDWLFEKLFCKNCECEECEYHKQKTKGERK